jgi:hypothetical protein
MTLTIVGKQVAGVEPTLINLKHLKIVEGATLWCSAGLMPSTITATPPLREYAEKKPLCFVNDYVFGTNIKPFGTCKITSQPCAPKFPKPWVSNSVALSPVKNNVLNETSVLLCCTGGQINVLNPGQKSVYTNTNGKVVVKSVKDVFPDITKDFIKRLKDTGATADNWTIVDKANAMMGANTVLPAIMPDKGLAYGLQRFLPKLSISQIEGQIAGAVSIELQQVPSKFAWFGWMTNPGHAWDYKSNIYRGLGQLQMGSHVYELDVTGNVAYGFTGRAAGISLTTLLVMAGLAQWNSDLVNHGKANFTAATNYDDPRDQMQIKAGADAYDKYNTSIDAAGLDDALAAYRCAYDTDLYGCC